jgi:hypothetical protein
VIATDRESRGFGIRGRANTTKHGRKTQLNGQTDSQSDRQSVRQTDIQTVRQTETQEINRRREEQSL